MKNDKNLNPIGQFKAQLNTPKTETRIILETEDLYPDLAVKKSKLSPAARQKIVNHHKPYQSQNQEDYGPCSYSGCNYPDKSFNVSVTFAAKVLFIEGDRTSWTIGNVEDARRMANAMSDKSTATLTNGQTADFSGGPEGELWINQTKRTSIARQLREFVRQHAEEGKEVINGISETN